MRQSLAEAQASLNVTTEQLNFNVGENQRLRKQYDQLNVERISDQQKCRQRDHQIEVLQEMIENYQKAQEQTSSQQCIDRQTHEQDQELIKTLQKQLDVQGQKLQDQMAVIKSYQIRTKAAQEENATLNQLLVQSNQLKDKSLEEYTASVKELNGQLQAQSRDLFKLKRLELSLTVLQKEYQRIAEENKTLHASLIQQDFDKRRLNDLQYQIKQLNEQISRAETIQRRQSEVILSAGSKALRLEKLLQDKETELKRVGADISRANKERDDALVQKDVAEATCQRTLAELDKTNQQLRAAFTDGAKWESENAQLRLQVENLNTKLDAKQKLLDEYSQKTQQLESELGTKKDELAQAKQQIDQLGAEYAQAKQDFEQKYLEAIRTQQDYKVLEEKLSLSQKQLSDQQQAHAQALSDMSAK